MGIIDAKLPKWANAEHTAINLVVTHSEYGDIPFTAAVNDIEPHSVALFNEAAAGMLGPVADYVAPPAVAARCVTMRQARLALLQAGLLTTVNDSVAAMAGAAGDAARIEWEYAQTVERGSALVASLAGALNLNAAALDALFTTAASL